MPMEKELKTRVGEKIRLCLGDRARLKSLDPLAGDASTRRYYRAGLAGEDLPPSLVVMVFSGSSLPLSSEELAVFETPPKELPFLNLHRFLGKLDLRIPALYGHWVDEGILLLEDLGDQSLWDEVQGLAPDGVARWYERAIDQLLTLQIRGTEQRDDSCMAFGQRFDFRLYRWEFEHFIEYGIEKGEKGTFAGKERELLARAFDQISRHLAKQPLFLNHRDYHSWNLMVSGQELVMIDFQDALLAPLQYDLASLLNDRDTDRIIRPEMEERLLSYYLDGLAAMGQEKVERDPFLETYRLSTLQRDFKVVGRFVYLELIKGKSQYKRYIPPTLKRIERNLTRFPGLAEIVPVLAPHFEGMR